MKNGSKTGAYVQTYAPFLLVIIIGFFYHIAMKPMGGDDVFFSNATADMTLWEYLVGRYVNWTSRVVSEGILVTVIQVPLVWRIIDFLMFASLPILISKIFGGGKLTCWFAAGAVLLFPFHDMGTAGWITTTVTHFWPLWGMFYLSLLLKKMIVCEKIPVWETVAAVPIGFMVGSHEQYAVIFFVLLIMCGIRGIYDRRHGNEGFLEQRTRRNVLFAILAVIDIISLVVIALCPGNAGRNAVSLADLPIYETFGFGDKLYLGLLSIERVFIANVDVVFFAVMLIWTWLVYLKTNDYVKTLISGAPLLVLFGQSVLRTAYPGLSGLFVIPGEVLEWSWGELSTWLPMCYLAVTVVCMIFALYQLFGEQMAEFLAILIMLGLGFGAGMVLGFMATIYVSGERVYAPLYAILLVVTIYAIRKMKEPVEARLKQTDGKLLATLLAVLCVTNVLFVGLSV